MIWNVAEAKPAFPPVPLERANEYMHSYSVDGKLLALSAGGRIILLRLETGVIEELRPQIGEQLIDGFEPSPDGTLLLVTSSFPYERWIFDVESPTARLLDHTTLPDEGRYWKLGYGKPVIADSVLLKAAKVLAGTELSASGVVTEITRPERIQGKAELAKDAKLSTLLKLPSQK
jgi:hypothetical protein